MNRTSSDPVSAAEPERAGWPRLGASSRPELRTLGPARVRRTHRGDRRWADRSSDSPGSGPRNLGIDELLAVVRPANRRAEATVRRLGMEWVGETDKYYDLRLQVYRLRPADFEPNSEW